MKYIKGLFGVAIILTVLVIFTILSGYIMGYSAGIGYVDSVYIEEENCNASYLNI